MKERNNTQQESQLPSPPLPSRFSDWSSLVSPHARTIPQSAPDRGVEQNVNIPNQLNVQSGTVARHETIRTNSPGEVIVPPPSNQQVEEETVQVREMESNPLSIEVSMQRDDMGTEGENNIPINQASGNVMPSLSVGDLTPSPNVHMESENNSDTSRGSHVRTQEIGLLEVLVIPPVERAISSRNRGVISGNIGIGQNYPCEGIYSQGTSTSNRRNYLDDSSDDNRSYRGQRYPNERGRPPDEGRYPNRDRRPPRRGGSQDDGRPRNGHGGHSSGGAPPDGGGPSDGGGPPDNGGPPDGNGGPQDALIEEDPQDLEDLLDQ